MERGEKQITKIGIIQAVLQTFNVKFQNTKIGTKVYSACACVLTGLRK